MLTLVALWKLDLKVENGTVGLSAGPANRKMTAAAIIITTVAAYRYGMRFRSARCSSFSSSFLELWLFCCFVGFLSAIRITPGTARQGRNW